MIPRKLIQEIKDNVEDIIAGKTALGKSLWKKCIALHPVDISDLLASFSEKHFLEVFLLLPQEMICPVFKHLSQKLQAKVIARLHEKSRLSVLNCLTTDELTDLFDHVSDTKLKEYLNLLHQKDREKILALLQFKPSSAGGIMDTDVLALIDDFTVQKSIRLIQRLQIHRELHRRIFVTNKKSQLVGFIFLEDLVLQKPHTHIMTFMRKNELFAYADENQEKIAKKMRRYHVTIVPVISRDNYFLGVIPDSTLLHVIEQEASEDVYRMSAMAPVKGTYFDMSFLRLLYERSYILIGLLLVQSLSSAIIKHNEALLIGVAGGFLMHFVTMLISTGGNASSQTSAVIIQGMASGEINSSNMKRFFRREVSMALIMASILGFIAFVRVYMTSENIIGSVAVSLSLALIVLVSIMVGSSIPVLLKRFNVDPAFSAGPVLATLMDILGLLIYCFVSRLILFSY